MYCLYVMKARIKVGDVSVLYTRMRDLCGTAQPQVLVRLPLRNIRTSASARVIGFFSTSVLYDDAISVVLTGYFSNYGILSLLQEPHHWTRGSCVTCSFGTNRGVTLFAVP